MKKNKLKKTRVIISLLFFIAMAFIFIDIFNFFDVQFIKTILYLQFIPSLLEFSDTIALTAAGFIFVIIITILLGRVYCSSICPLGTIQDVSIYIKRKFKKKEKYQYKKPHNILRYSILILSVVSLFSGILLIINFLDPYSNTGRIFIGLFKPIVIFANNTVSSILESFDIYSLHPIKNIIPNFWLLLFPFCFLIFIIWLSLKYGRLYCNTLCPVGALLSLFSRFSIFKLKIDEAQCTSCRNCERVCKANCIDVEKKEIDFSRCINCFNCISSCSLNGIGYKLSIGRIKNKKSVDTSKREFVRNSLKYIIGLTSLSFIQQRSRNQGKGNIIAKSQFPVTPPGSENIERFTRLCTACHLCVSACPTKVLQPAFLDYGISGMLQPKMDFNTNFCNYECVLCGQVCPTGAIKELQVEEKKLVQIGVAKFIEDNCIVKLQNTECGACSEHCPTKACYMVPYGDVHIPQIRRVLCIGCGACEYVCPAKPNKAIYVESNDEHSEAHKPPEENIEYEQTDDFPF